MTSAAKIFSAAAREHTSTPPWMNPVSSNTFIQVLVLPPTFARKIGSKYFCFSPCCHSVSDAHLASEVGFRGFRIRHKKASSLPDLVVRWCSEPRGSRTSVPCGLDAVASSSSATLDVLLSAMSPKSGFPEHDFSTIFGDGSGNISGSRDPPS